ncbi:protein-glutamate O-methyltransferase CheR [Luteolibacter sp. Populi]|uniref:CheR family methyltransferase n=1 Tax=Luteolibacter sp. Populi TaxID=3230487 RepID=UPI0034663A7C
MSPLPSRDSRFAGISFAGKSSPRIPVIRGAGSLPCSAKPRLTLRPDRFDELEDRTTDDAVFLSETLLSAGLDPARYRMAPLRRRLPACLRALRANSLHEAAEILRAAPERLALALNTLLIGTSSFFRDEPVFEHLASSVIPTLVARCTHPRVWSAACSDGAELYSVAMLLARYRPLAGDQLLGSDFRPRAIELAKRGIYPAEEAAAVPTDLRGRFLSGGRSRVIVSAELRRATRWECRDLLEAPPRQSWDLVLCRNLAIYLAGPAVENLWKKLAAVLAPGGVLVVGKAEKPRIPGLKRIAPCIYRYAP